MSGTRVVLFGGSSSERRVSVASAQNVLTLLPDAEPWFMSVDGRVHLPPRSRVLEHQRPFERELDPGTPPRWASIDQAVSQPGARDRVLFLAVHGGDGENGKLQAILERAGVAFTGSGSAASARAFDKVEAKRVVSEKGVRVAPSQVVQPKHEHEVRSALEAFHTRAPDFIAKPVADGSSMGLLRVRQPKDIASAVRHILDSQVMYLLEPFLKGTELTVGVIEETVQGPPQALPVSEVRLEETVQFDYDAKYLGRGSKEITPAEIPAALFAQAQAAAVSAHQALGCSGYSRTDLIATTEGIYFLETNTLPGLTKASFIPQQLEAAKRSLRDFLEAQLSLAVARARR